MLCASRLLPVLHGAESPVYAHFQSGAETVLREHCFECHGDGVNKGNVTLDEFTNSESLTNNPQLWMAVLKNVRSGLMPPRKKERVPAEEIQHLANWIKYDAFGIDPQNPDPGRITLRRLNRHEYHNTIRELVGVDYDTATEFPADNAGYGFDNIGDVLTLSPMLMEKYLNAAEKIISSAVPMKSRVMPEAVIPGSSFQPQYFSYYETNSVTNHFTAKYDGHYEVALDLTAQERYVDDQFDYNKCRLFFYVDGNEASRADFNRESGVPFHYESSTNWKRGEHEFVVRVFPLTTNLEHLRDLHLRMDSITVRGPKEDRYWIAPPHYARFFPEPVPEDPVKRKDYARRLIKGFAEKAFRHPVDEGTLTRLVFLAEGSRSARDGTFESGIARAMTAILASPRFIFLQEEENDRGSAGKFEEVGEYDLASRLSYFLWSSMPDEELFRLAREGHLRENLPAQIKRMLADPRSKGFVENFTGQWLQARDIDSVTIDARTVLQNDDMPDPESQRMRDRLRELFSKPDAELTPDERVEFKKLRASARQLFKPARRDLTGEIRDAMRAEVNSYFTGLIREDRSVTELVDSHYTYLNQKLAEYYDLTNLAVQGREMRRVVLPDGCPRGGVLTMGAVLTVTSNPTRTSPVKRGLFILDNILGTPPPPPPANVPPLEDSARNTGNRHPTLRETLAIHRENPMCASCHNRMDPLGLALENFNALGMWRDREQGNEIVPSGMLITGESFTNMAQLKHILATDHRDDFYRTITEKMLTYALGRGLEYYDVETEDAIVGRLQKENGRFSALLEGVIESAPFQKRRTGGTFPSTSTNEHK